LKREYSRSLHVEKQIYDGFTQKADELLMDTFHEASWSDRHAIVEKFQDARLKMIGMQLIHLEQPKVLDHSVCREHHRAAAKRLLGECDEVSWLTVSEALLEIEEMLSSATGPNWSSYENTIDIFELPAKRHSPTPSSWYGRVVSGVYDIASCRPVASVERVCNANVAARHQDGSMAYPSCPLLPSSRNGYTL
jgi:hypothetical protein